MPKQNMPLQTVSQDTLLEKYCKGKEASAGEIFDRVANGLAEAETASVRAHWRARFRWAMEHGFIPAGRVLSACGTDVAATLINCFVQPVGDSVSSPETDPVSGQQYPSIYEAARLAAETMRRGGGVGYNFSRIRPAGARVLSTHSRASGPLSYMRIFDVSCATVESAGARRGAQMGILNIDHPDVLDFIHAKHEGAFTNFNLSVGVSDAFMEALMTGADWELVHRAEPDRTLEKLAGAYQREDGMWVYRRLPARDIWEAVMRSTYEIGEPGIQFLGRIAAENPLSYTESIDATNPCAEEPLPNYGCCCLGSIDLTRFVSNPFSAKATFDYEGYFKVAKVAARMLDNVLDVTLWPLDEQRREASEKRRVGLGFTGLGDAIIMMGHRYDSLAAVKFGETAARVLRDAAYTSSAQTAREKGPFPLFDVKEHLDGEFCRRLPLELRRLIAKNGLRNSHLLSIAPTGTISLALADNASNGIEPPFSLSYQRRKRNREGGWDEYEVLDHAYRVWTEQLGGSREALPEAFSATALTIGVEAHRAMMEAVQPFIDAAVSKTVNIPADYPFEEFKALYEKAWRGGLKSIATFRPNETLGSILSETEKASPEETPAEGNAPAQAAQPEDLVWVNLQTVPTTPPLATLRAVSRPEFPDGNLARTYTVQAHGSRFAITIGEDDNGPFEVWVMGEPPRGLGALAKSLSVDMRSRDHAWLERKLKALKKCAGQPLKVAFPPTGEERLFPSAVAAFAALVDYHCRKCGWFENESSEDAHPLLDAMMTAHEPKTGPDGTLAWSVDVENGATGDELVLFAKELKLPDGTRRPYSIWMAGDYPRALDGLAISLSLDMRVLDIAWVAKKLRQIRHWSEPLGEFFARRPGSEKSRTYPSTTAYLADLLLHRFKVLGLLDEEGFPIDSSVDYYPDEMEEGAPDRPALRAVGAMEAMAGKRCPECGNYSVIKKDGCEHCTNCGAQGGCG
jgi:ribonucleoside-diphosphate reductase alpha chain